MYRRRGGSPTAARQALARASVTAWSVMAAPWATLSASGWQVQVQATHHWVPWRPLAQFVLSPSCRLIPTLCACAWCLCKRLPPQTVTDSKGVADP